ncbi:MAG: hypothetical protein ABI650_10905 [Dokdonella sp.]
MAHVKYSKALIKRAVRHQVSKALGGRYWLVITLLAGFGCMAFLSGGHVWLGYVAGALLLQAFVLPLVVMHVRTKSAIARLWTLGSHGLAIDMHCGRFRAHSAMGSVDLPLSRITAVTCSEDYWLLHSGRSTMMLLPTADVPWPTADGWLNELRQAGVRVV